ncbi:hypothetical protein [Nocardia vaccinii]|uniref:hypothetical protein n=1 Tax=Nocardia vaccinii TaxID=1822 RepID=UPI0012F4CB71|nr:hypothetical protein [Nocardia vaccinii]
MTRTAADVASTDADEATVSVDEAVPTTPTNTVIGDADAPPCVTSDHPELLVLSVDAAPGVTRTTYTSPVAAPLLGNVILKLVAAVVNEPVLRAATATVIAHLTLR